MSLEDVFGRIGAVVVTYNRLECLKKTLNAYERMDYYPAFLIVVDNHSNNDTQRFLEEWVKEHAQFSKVLIRTESNIGGAGGFKTGIEEALRHGCDWVFVADDDAVPGIDIFREFEIALEKLPKNIDFNNLSAICATVKTSQGIDTTHRRRISRRLFHIDETPVSLDEYKQDYFWLDEFSYVGTMMNSSALNAVGLTNENFFIFHDDTDHSLRLRTVGSIACFPSAIIYHKAQLKSQEEIPWRMYYDIRNRLLMIRRNFPKLIYRYHLLDSYIKKASFLAKVYRKRTATEIYVAKCAINDAARGVEGLSRKFLPGVDASLFPEKNERESK